MKIIAHRGASGLAPENTLKAMELALQSEACAIEIDVYSSHGQLMVIHDRWLHKRTNGIGQIHQTSLEKLAVLDAGEGQNIPSLRQLLSFIDGRCDVNIELKGADTAVALIDEIGYAIAHSHFDKSQFLISSFNHHLLQQVHNLDPQLKIGALTAGLPLDYCAFAEQLNAYSVHCDVDFINAAMVTDAHQRGLKIFVYTVDEEEDIKTLQKLNVDGIFSNFPCKARKTSNSQPTRPMYVWSN
ncbi:glycerophosphodiester phosphodiesterase family protein [Paraferrimonas sp. SM1919]|uniref:glycerophosphodiester phosphodiesterase n=1 Tax=Paraferrimonas sp. SM1919 TaxID=2662263 RepID=UPI0013D0A0A6|nr:glycerophosphodiester phosphodiesterase family protein [Paraferrimonas sp. SM1919]